jgi:hypothetical protein
MAVPGRDDPNLPKTRIDDLGDQQIVERVTRGGWRWWWIWPVIIALVVWWAGWGWGGSGGWWWGRAHAHNTAIPAPPGSQTTETLANAGAKQPVVNPPGGPEELPHMSGPGVKILNAENKHAFIGKQFEADEVPVREKLSNNAMWIGLNDPMLAVVTDKGASKSAEQAKIVDARGRVEKAPPAARAKREWNLSDQDASRLEKEGAYIQVSQLTVEQK